MGFAAPSVADAEERERDPADDGPTTRSEVSGERTENAKVYREPDGTYTAEISAVPLHYRKADGTWAPIDLTIGDSTRSGYRWGNRTGPFSVDFAEAGRPSDMVRVAVGSETFTFGPLSASAASGSVDVNRITYPALYPDTDLRLSLTPKGLRKEFILARAPATDRFRLSVGGSVRVAETSHGGLRFLNGAGKVLLETPAPLMWDTPPQDHPDPAYSGDVRFHVTEEGGAQVVELVFDRGWLEDPQRRYPVTIDPVVTKEGATVTQIHSAYPTTNFNSDENLSTGKDGPGTGGVGRSLLLYNVADLIGAQIASADLKVWNWWAPNCVSSWVNAVRITQTWSGSTVTWNTQPTMASTPWAQSAIAYGSSGCPANWAQFDLQSLVQRWADEDPAYPNYGIALRSDTEGNGATYKKYRSDNYSPGGATDKHPKLVVNYNHPPATPTSLSPPSPTTGGGRPTLSGTFSDSNPGDQGYVQFEVRQGSTVVVSGDGNLVGSGQASSWQVPSLSLSSGQTYTWRARAWDGTHSSGWTADQTYAVSDASPPDGPMTAPGHGDTISGIVTISTVPDDGAAGSGVDKVDFFVDQLGIKRLIGTDTDGTDGWSISFSSYTASEGPALLRAEYVDGIGNRNGSPVHGRAAVTINNGSPAPEDWAAAVGTEGLAATDDTDGQVVLGSGALAMGVAEAEVPARGFAPSHQRSYLSQTQAGGILGRSWRSSLEDYVVREVDGDLIHIDGAGREHRFAATPVPKLTAKYWKNTTRSGTPDFEREDANIDFNWAGSPGGTIGATDSFSVRWNAYIDIPAAGTWTFYTETDDGVMAWIDGRKVIGNWKVQPLTEVSGQLPLSAGRHLFQMEYFNEGRPAIAKASWSGPGVTKQVIPASAFSHDQPPTNPYTAPAGVYDKLVRETDGSYTLTDTAQIVTRFGASGRRDSITDPHGNSLSLYYDAAGRPLYVCSQAPCDAGSTRITLAYNATTGLLSSVSDDAGRTWTYTYDAIPRLTRVTGPEGETTDYAYTSGRLSQVTDAMGGVAQVGYDASARVVSVKDPAAVPASGPATTLLYDTPATGKVTVRAPVATAAGSGGDIYTLGPGGTQASITDPVGRTTSFEYDANFNVTQETDPVNNRTVIDYDARGNVLAEKEYAGQTLLRQTSYAYDDRNNLTNETAPDGKVTTYAYDAAKLNLVSVTDPAGTTTYTYDSAGEMLTETNPLGATTTYEYDANGNRTAEIDAAGSRTTFAYDAAGNVTGETVAAGTALAATATSTYDRHGNVLSETDPEGGVTRHAYDALDRQTSETDATGHTSTTVYDAAGRVTQERDPLGNATTYAYDSNGNTTVERDPRGNENTYTYDAADQLVEERAPTDGGPAVTRYTYDLQGRNDTVTDPKGGITDYDYDALGRVTQEIVKDSATDTTPQITSYTYDLADRVLSRTEPAGNAPGAIPADYATDYRYDAAGRLAEVEDPLGQITRYAHDAAGNQTRITDPAGAVTEFAYDDVGRPTLRRTAGTRSNNQQGSVNSTTNPQDDIPVSADASGMIQAALAWDPVPALKTSTSSGALAEGATAPYPVDAHGEAVLEASLTWAPSSKPRSTGFTQSLGALGSRTHTISVTATNKPIVATLDWAKASVPIAYNESVAASSTKSYTFSVNTDGTIEATLNWSDAAVDLDLRLRGPGGAEVACGCTLLGRPESLSYAVGAAASGTYTLEVKNNSPVSGASFSLSGSYPYVSNLDVELRDPAGGLVAAAQTGGRPESLTYQPAAEGTYSLKAISRDQSTPSYTLSASYPVTSSVQLLLRDPAGTAVRGPVGTSRSLKVTYLAPAPGGAYRWEVVNRSTDTDVPSYTLVLRTTVVHSTAETGALAESAAASHQIEAEDAGAVRSSVTWVDGTKVATSSWWGSIPAGTTQTRTVTADGADHPVTATLNWSPTTKSYSFANQSVAGLGSNTHDIEVNAVGQIQASLSWSSNLDNLDLELSDPAGVKVAESKAIASTSETITYTIAAGGPTGTYRLKVINVLAGAVTYTLSGSHAHLANLDLELVDGGGTVVAQATTAARPEALSLATPVANTTYTIRIISNDAAAASSTSWSLTSTYPDTATALVRLRLYRPDGTLASETQGTSKALTATSDAAGRGTWRAEVANLSADTDVPSYTVHLKAPTTSRVANLDLELRNSSGAVVASSEQASGRTEQLTYPNAAQGTYTLRVIARTYDATYRLDYGVPKAQEETTTYNARGEVASTEALDGPGPITHTYDRAGRLTQAALPDATTETYAYDAAGRTTQITDPTGTQTFTYDATGQLATAIDPSGVTTTYGYDVAGNESSVSRQGDTPFSFLHDPQSRFEQRVEGAQTTTVAYGDKVYPTRLTHQSGEVDERAFRPTGEVDALELRPAAGAAPTLALDHSYDLQGNLNQVRDVTAAPFARSSYGYDRADRLIQETLRLGGDDVAYTYAYDAQGNRTSKVAPEGTTTYTYNPAGQLVSQDGPGAKVTYFYDERGNLAREVSAAGATTYAWTSEEELESVTKPDGAVIAFEYDPDGNRTRKIAGDIVTEYEYEGGRLTRRSRAGQTTRFSYDDRGAPISFTDSSGTYLLRFDEGGSVLGIDRAQTGEQIARYAYDAWGNIRDASGDPDALAENETAFLGFHGVLFDDELGLYWMGSRYYDASIGRFISRDPIEAEPQQSSYSYAANNPIRNMDPEGTHPRSRSIGMGPVARQNTLNKFFRKYRGNRSHGTAYLGFGKAIKDFLRWEISSGRIGGRGRGSRWWRAVNGGMMLDIKKASAALGKGRRSSSDLGTGLWMEYAKWAKSKRPSNRYVRHRVQQGTLWRAHQWSLHHGIDTTWDLFTRERRGERSFIRAAVTMVDIAAVDMQGTDTPRVFNLLKHHYPKHYPVRKSELRHVKRLAALGKAFYFYTWRLPRNIGMASTRWNYR